MYLKTIILFLLVFLCFSCTAETYNDAKENKLNEERVTSTPIPFVIPKNKMSKEDREGWEQGSYSTVLTKLVSIDSKVFVGKDTIKLENLESLNDLYDVSQETKNDFLDKNKSSEEIKDKFDVYAKVELLKVGNLTTKTIKEIKEKHPKSEAIILLSRVGLNNNATEFLIYVEKYDFTGAVKKVFCFISRDEKNGVDVKWFEVK